MKFSFSARAAYALAAIIFVLDQLSKWWIVSGLQLESLGSVLLLPFLSFTWVENAGVAMGLLTAGSEAARWTLVALTGGIATAIIWWINAERDGVDLAAMGLILGGAI
ncbi:MAG: signal peptidase II, partial [Pseudomonadota bacterium]